MSNLRPVLLVEDDENDIAILHAAFADLQVANPIRAVQAGEAALEYLQGTGEYQDRGAYPFPGLMLLDLKLAGISGFEVLRWLAEHPQFKTNLRVVVLSALAIPTTAQLVRQLGADEFLEKPLGYGQLKEDLKGVLARWESSVGARA